MALTMYAASVPVFKQILTSLAAILEKAEAHATAKKIDPNALLQARLFPDMFPLVRQVQLATDFAKGAGARLAGQDVPKYEDNEQTFGDLQARIAKTVAFLDTLRASDFEGAEERQIVITNPSGTREFKGQPYLVHYVLAHFFFHAATAYDLLRHNGVEVGKKDFIGSF
ncbi:MAG: DUF1993 domain-containing protein [Telluria sp.]